MDAGDAAAYAGGIAAGAMTTAAAATTIAATATVTAVQTRMTAAADAARIPGGRGRIGVPMIHPPAIPPAGAEIK